MNDINRDEAHSETSKAQDKIHERNYRIARLWWKYFAIRKVNKAIKKGKNEVRILAPIRCASEIGGILMARKFHYSTYQRNIFLTDVWIEWY
jgi:hypothetical protein